MGFFDWLDRTLRRLRGAQERSVPEPPPEQETFRGGPVEYSGQSFWEADRDIPDCETGYAPGREIIDRKGRKHVSIPRWYAVNPTIDCVRDLFRMSSFKSHYVMVVHGEPCNPYPGQEGEEEVHITYAIEGNTLLQLLAGAKGILEFLDEVNELEPLIEVSGECEHAWEVVNEIDILDR